MPDIEDYKILFSNIGLGNPNPNNNPNNGKKIWTNTNILILISNRNLLTFRIFKSSKLQDL
jgi:hypothetical protein